ncbi:MAG: hypothetical protein ACOZCO_10910 [Bacteroidota bacterium]
MKTRTHISLFTIVALSAFTFAASFAHQSAELSEYKKPSSICPGCSFNGKKLYGKVQVVTAFPDIKVQVVDAFPDIKVKMVDAFPDACGKWQLVDAFPDFKIQFVTAFPDVKIKYVDAFPGCD